MKVIHLQTKIETTYALVGDENEVVETRQASATIHKISDIGLWLQVRDDIAGIQQRLDAQVQANAELTQKGHDNEHLRH